MPQSDASTSSLTFAEKLLGLAGFTVRSVDFLEDGSLQVYVERKQWRFQCRRCLEHSLAPHSSTERKVRHLACFEYKVFLLVDVYRLFCPTCGVVTERHPLLALHHRCTERFASVVAFLCKRMSIQDVAGALQLSWHTVKEIDKEYIEAHLEDRDFSGLRRIGVDEIAFRTGHRYLTIVTDLDSHDVIWIGGREREQVVVGLFPSPGQEDLPANRSGSLRHVACLPEGRQALAEKRRLGARQVPFDWTLQ